MCAEKTTTYSLRLTDQWKGRLERNAENQGVSVNQLILDIIAQHYRTAGFHQGPTINLKNGRTLEIRVEQSKLDLPGMPTCWFYLDDPHRNREIASYQIGASQQLMRQFGVERKDEYTVVAELGKALLHFHNEHGRNIARLEWQQLPTKPEMRILDTNDIKRIDKSYIITQEDFHATLAQPDQWLDRHLRPPVKPILTRTIALSLQHETSAYYNEHISSVPDTASKEQLAAERDEVINLLGSLVPEGLTNLGLGDRFLNDKEVHVFSERWKPGHPDLESNRVILEIGSAGASQAIANFVYETSGFFLESGQKFVCRWIENGQEKERELIAR
jgi:hypothetical protein